MTCMLSNFNEDFNIVTSTPYSVSKTTVKKDFEGHDAKKKT